MRILFVCRDTSHASSRVRALQYVEPLRCLGHDVDTIVWQPHRSLDVAGLAAQLVATARRADVVVLVKPRLHRAVLAALARVQSNVWVDVDDAVWTWPPPFPERLDHAGRLATGFIAGSAFLAEQLSSRYPHAIVQVVPTSVDTARYVPTPGRGTRPAVVGWIGGPASLTDFVPPVAAALRMLAASGEVTLRIVCSEGLDPSVVPSEFERWSDSTEVASLQGFDIGIMPLRDDEQSWGRCGLKALQYMAVGVPVVASPVGAALQIVDHGESGLLATTEAEWLATLTHLASDADARATMGKRARRRVEDAYSVTSNAPLLAHVLDAKG